MQSTQLPRFISIQQQSAIIQLKVISVEKRSRFAQLVVTHCGLLCVRVNQNASNGKEELRIPAFSLYAIFENFINNKKVTKGHNSAVTNPSKKRVTSCTNTRFGLSFVRV